MKISILETPFDLPSTISSRFPFQGRTRSILFPSFSRNGIALLLLSRFFLPPIHSRKNSPGEGGEERRGRKTVVKVWEESSFRSDVMFHERSRLLNWKLPTSVLGFIFKQRIVADDLHVDASSFRWRRKKKSGMAKVGEEEERRKRDGDIYIYIFYVRSNETKTFRWYLKNMP